MSNGTSLKKYQVTNEILNTLTHGIGVILSIVGLTAMLSKAELLGSHRYMLAYGIFGATLITLFLSSTLYHSLVFTKAKRFFQIVDHNAIFLLIAGSYTPYCLLSLKGLGGWILYGIIWILALLGIVYKSMVMSKIGEIPKNSTGIYIGMSSLLVLSIYPIYQSIGALGIALLIAGGAAYLIGTIFYSLKKVKYSHVIWHLFVMLGANCVFFSILLTT